MNVSPAFCPVCGHRFPPGAAEPTMCPDCRRECTGSSESRKIDPPLSDEMLATLEQRARWRISCLAFLVVGPLCTVLWMFFKQDILSALPGSLQPFAELGSHPILPLGLCAAGAGFCLAKLWFPRGRLVDILAYAFLISFVIMVGYGAFFLASGAILRALFVKPGQ